FHGLDLYSVQESAQRIPVLLEQLDPLLAKKISHRFSTIDQSEQVLKLFDHIKPQETPEQQWLLFDLHQNAKVVHNGLRFKRASEMGDDRPWNIRDRHMMESLKSVFNHYGPSARGIVWAHINHVSDLRRESGNTAISLGGLAKEAFGEKAVSLVAFLTHSGSVIASPRWEGPVKTMVVPSARAKSIEEALDLISKKRNSPNLLLIFDSKSRQGPLSSPLSYRFVAVVYDPKKERQENYLIGQLPDRFDALFFVDKTRALEPMISRDYSRDDLSIIDTL
ncbi:MAG: erythromycin esterase family protein, partial [Bacteriovorax sp.]